MIPVVVLALVASLVSMVASKGGDCLVCTRVFDQIYETLTEADKKDHEKIEAKIGKFCSAQHEGEGRRVCYSIETLKREAAKPMTYGMPSDKVCAKLAKRDYEICRIPEGGGVKKTELKDIGDPEKLKIKDIKEVLSDNGVKCNDCTEKGDYVRKLKELLVSKGIKTEL